MIDSTLKRTYFFHVCTGLLAGLLIAFSGCSDKEEIIDRSPLLTTADVSNVFINSAVCGGNISHDMNDFVTARGVCWSKSPNPTIMDNKTEDGKGAGSFTSILTGLESKTTYYVRAYATNSSGTGYGATIVFTTIQGLFDTRDGNAYKTVNIGAQEWMAENLRYLPQVAPPTNGSASAPFYYVYGYIGDNVDEAKASSKYPTYGVLYNWPAAMAGAESSDLNPSGVQGACPAGWHIPSQSEWLQLIDYLGGMDVAGGMLKETGTANWASPNTGATNETGFTGLPGGYRFTDGSFYSMTAYANWWAATEASPGGAFDYFTSYNNSKVGQQAVNKTVGLSVRCIKD